MTHTNPRRPSKNKKILFVVIGFVLIFAIACWFGYWPYIKHFHSYEYSTIFSPDKKHKLVVYGTRVFPMIMPGTAGDVPGFVRLYAADGMLLNEKDIDMVQWVDQVEWSEEKVYIKLFAQWGLDE